MPLFRADNIESSSAPRERRRQPCAPRTVVFDHPKYHGMVEQMTAKISIDKAGRVIIPKSVRESLQLRPGDELELESSDDRITLRPARGQVKLRKKRGIWVYNPGEPVTVSEVERVLEQVRRERDEHNLRGGG